MSKSNSSKFNQKLTKLENIYNSIKNIADNDLDNLITLYKEGIQLAKELEKEIQEFEFAIQTVHSDTKHSEQTAPHKEVSQELSQELSDSQTQEHTPHTADGNTIQDAPPTPINSTQYVADLFSSDDDELE